MCPNRRVFALVEEEYKFIEEANSIYDDGGLVMQMFLLMKIKAFFFFGIQHDLEEGKNDIVLPSMMIFGLPCMFDVQQHFGEQEVNDLKEKM